MHTRRVGPVAAARTVNETQLRDAILGILRGHAGNAVRLDECCRTVRLVEDLGIGPVRLVDLLVAVESEFGIEITDEEVDWMHTIGDVIRLVETKHAA